MGARVQARQVDVADFDQVAGLLRELNVSEPPLRGIVHAAGVLDDGLLARLSLNRFLPVLAPKAQGAWNLHQLTREQRLDFFVCFSSAASLLGSPGQGSYAAANGFLDALCQERAREGLPGLSINWSGWGEAGMAAQVGERERRRWAALGVGLLETREALDVFENLVASGKAGQVAALALDWPRFLQQFPAGMTPPFLDRIAHQPSPIKGATESGFLPRWRASAPAERRNLLGRYLRETLAGVLGEEDCERIDPERSFFDLGLDSLKVVEFKNLLEFGLGQTLPGTLAFNYPTVQALAGYLWNQMEQTSSMLEGFGSTPAEGAPTSSPVQAALPPLSASTASDENHRAIEALSESDAEAALAAELDRLGL